jgi:YidC/Oxa1 family membrane protein insertase
MPAAPQKRSSTLQFLLIFIIVYLGSQLIIRQFFPSQDAATGGIELSAASSFRMGVTPIVTIKNHTATGYTLPSRCPYAPFDTYDVGTPEAPKDKPVLLTGTGLSGMCLPIDPIAPGKSAMINLGAWKYSLFSTATTYEVRIPDKALPKLTGSGAQNVASVRFAMTVPGTFTQLFRTFITKPFLNFLIFVASLTPGHNLGIAIIILTLVVKFLLFWPTQKALESQKKMQMLQPKLEELKRKYPDDARKQQEETMKLWKEHGINPFGACLPTVIQLPILIGLFYVIRDGSHLEVSRHLIYSFYQHLDWNFGTQFLWFNLLKPDYYVFPFLLVALQFIQMKMTFAIQKRKDAKAGKTPGSSQDTQQKVMQYAFPLMIGIFAFQFPAAVSLYWGVSTLFAIGQQAIVNREHLKV